MLSAGKGTEKEFSSFSPKYPISYQRAILLQPILLEDDSKVSLKQKIDLLLLCKNIRASELVDISRAQLANIAENCEDFSNLSQKSHIANRDAIFFDQQYKEILTALENSEDSTKVIQFPSSQATDFGASTEA